MAPTATVKAIGIPLSDASPEMSRARIAATVMPRKNPMPPKT